MPGFDLRSAISAFMDGRETEADRRAIRHALEGGHIALASGERAVAVGGNVEGAIITGNNNLVLSLDKAEFKAVQLMFDNLIHKLTPQTEAGITLRYDSDAENPPFGSWFKYSENGVSPHSVSTEIDSEGYYVSFRSDGDENMGINKSINFLKGIVRFEYRAYSDIIGNIAAYAIPMQDTKFNQFGIIEVGANRMAERANEVSSHRKRLAIAAAGSHAWRETQIEFDFSMISQAFYTIFALRINEGCLVRGPAQVLIRRVKVFSSR
jgi:hypothetical protein